jgi:hypothetical protein
MLWRVLHDMLKWLGISFFPAIGFTVVAAVGLAQGFPESKPWILQQFANVVAVMENPAFWTVAFFVFVAWLSALIWSAYEVGKPSQGGTTIHIQNNYAPLSQLAGTSTPSDPEPKLDSVMVQPDDAHMETMVTEPRITHNLEAQNVATGSPQITSPELSVTTPAAPQGDTLEATGVLFPLGLYVGMVIVSASKLTEAGNILEIAIRGSNGTGEMLRIGGIEGTIYDDTPYEPAELPPPALREGFASEIEPYTEFMVVLDQPLPARLAEQILGLAEGDYVSLDLRDLNIFVELVDNPANRARLPLWDGIGLRRRDDIFTNRMTMMSLQASSAPTASLE